MLIGHGICGTRIIDSGNDTLQVLEFFSRISTELQLQKRTVAHMVLGRAMHQTLRHDVLRAITRRSTFAILHVQGALNKCPFRNDTLPSENVWDCKAPLGVYIARFEV